MTRMSTGKHPTETRTASSDITAGSPQLRLSAYLALALGVLALGFSAIFVRLADAPGTVSAFYRMAIGAGVMAPVFFRQLRSQRSRLTRRAVRLAAIGGVLFALDLAFWASGVVAGGATFPTLMANTAPLWVGLGALLLFRERLRWGFWFGLMVAMIGVIFVFGADLGQAATVSAGSLLGLLAAVFYGAYYLVTQRGRVYLNALTYFWLTTAISAVTLLLINVILGRSFGGYDDKTYLSLLALGVGPQAIGWLAVNYAQGFLPAALVAPTLLGQPLITAVIAVLFLDERFTSGHVVGGIGVLLGIYIVHWSRLRDRAELETMEVWPTEETI